MIYRNAVPATHKATAADGSTQEILMRFAPLSGLLATAALAAMLTGCTTSQPIRTGSERPGPTSAGPRAEATQQIVAPEGRDALNYPPSPVVDYLNMRLEINIPDMNRPRLSATETLTFRALLGDTRGLTLNAVDFKISEIRSTEENRDVEWSYDGEEIRVAFEPPLDRGHESGLVINYTLDDPVDGLFWTPESQAWPDRPAQIHTQGEAASNRYWFASHDFPNERLTTELIVTVPEGYQVSGNGRLVSEETVNGRTTYHWLQGKSHTSYLVSLIVGKFEVVDIAGGETELPMDVWVPVGWGEMVPRTYGATPEMVRVFETLFDEPYPWDRYSQLLVWNFGAGGMENTSATTMYDTAILSDHALLDGDLDGLIAHELGHQWFGDLLTCDSWEHIWLNEGLATYSEALWFEERDGLDGYLYDIYNNFRAATRFDRIEKDDDRAWQRPGMVSKVWDDPNDVFRRRSNPYPKGGSIVHMLRMMLGDEAFFLGLQLYIDRNKFSTVETSDFRQVLEEVSGLNLEQFFQQWVYRPGTPEVIVHTNWDPRDGRFHIDVEQTQRIDEMTPAFAFTLPIELYVDDEPSLQVIELAIDSRRQEIAIPLKIEPRMVVVDPLLTVLMSKTVEQPTERFITQLRDGPTLPSRLDAAVALGTRPDSDTTAALRQVVADSTLHHALRARAATSLGELGEESVLINLLSESRDDARVRRAVVDALRETGSSDAVSQFRSIAVNPSESYETRGAALRGLGDFGEPADAAILISALEVDSADDEVRQQALRALADLDEADGLGAAIQYSMPGTLNRTRAVAIGTVGSLAPHDVDAAVDALLPLLNDREVRARNAAGRALAEIGDERALTDLDRLAKSARDPRFREQCERWADQIRKREDEPEQKSLEKRIERLERQLKALQADGNGG
jgi:aminopeptidase N